MKAPNVNIKEILKKLGFLRNNLGLLVPILIAMVALLLFIPTRILSGKLQATVEQGSAGTGRQIESLTRQIRQAAPAGSREAYVDAYSQDVNEIDAMMAQTVYRELLSYEVFRDTNETSMLLFDRFGRRYREGVEAMVAALHAGACPTDAEIQAALDSAPRVTLEGTRGGTYDRDRTRSSAYRMGTQWSLQAMTEVERGIFDEICTGKAKAAKVYATPADIAGYAYWDDWKFENRDKAYEQSWFWQLGYWIAEDVVTTIRAVNEGSQNVLDAPVKRLMNVSFQLQSSAATMVARRGRARRKVEEYPTYVTDQTNALTTPCTARFSNDDIDVLHFEVRVVVDESQVLPFIQELCSAKQHKFLGFDGKQRERTYQHNQITVLETSVGPIEPISIDHQSYRYGSNPAVELDLICEYVLPKVAAFEEIKPKQVRESASDEDESEIQ
jgi:hypothetical protein